MHAWASGHPAAAIHDIIGLSACLFWVQDMLGEVWQTHKWTQLRPTDLPRQENDYDCGVFMLMACNRLGLKRDEFDFSQQNMGNLRAAMAYDLRACRIAASAHPQSALMCDETAT